MPTVTQDSPSPKNPKTRLVYRPSISCFDGEVYWRLYTTEGVRWTPDILTTAQLMAYERGLCARFGPWEFPPTVLQYYVPEWV